MSQVSRRFINRTTQERIFNLFVSGLIMCNAKDTTVSLIDDLLTPTERVMLAKRFSIAYMLSEGYSYDMIEQTLKVSRTTIGRVSLWLKEKGAGFRTVIGKIKRHEGMKKILEGVKDSIEEFIAGVPGQNWSRSKSALWRSRLERQKPF